MDVGNSGVDLLPVERLLVLFCCVMIHKTCDLHLSSWQSVSEGMAYAFYLSSAKNFYKTDGTLNLHS